MLPFREPTIVVTDTAKGTSVSLTSNGEGLFTVAHLIPDTYNVKVSAPGFKGYETKGLQIFADSSQELKAVLAVGASDQVVQVNADTQPQLKDRSRGCGDDLYGAGADRAADSGPTTLRTCSCCCRARLQLGWAHAASENPQGSKQIQIDGQAFGGVNYTLDGTDNQDAILGIIVINPNSESMSEAKIATQNFDAEFGKAVASVQSGADEVGYKCLPRDAVR